MNPNNNMLTVVHTSGIVRVPVVSSEEQASPLYFSSELATGTRTIPDALYALRRHIIVVFHIP